MENPKEKVSPSTFPDRSIDNVRRVACLRFLYMMASPGQWIVGDCLYRMTQYSMIRECRFEDVDEFRAFMGAMVDAGLVVEKTGRTMAADTIGQLEFRISEFLAFLVFRLSGAC